MPASKNLLPPSRQLHSRGGSVYIAFT